MTFEPNDTVTTSTPLTPASASAALAPTPTPDPAPAGPDEPIAPAAVVAVAAPRKRGPVDWLLAGAAVLAVGGLAFAVGRTTAPAAASGFTGLPDGAISIQPGGSFDPGDRPVIGGPGFLGAGGPTIDGTVTAIDAESVTIKLANGDEMTFELDDDTTYHESTATDPSSIAVGDDVAVRMDGGRISFGGPGGGQGDDGGTTTDGNGDGSGRDGTTPSASDITVQR